MLVPMTKIAVVGHRARLDTTLALLQRLAVLHVVEATPEALGVAGYVPGPEELSRLQRLRDAATRVDAMVRLATEHDATSGGPSPALPHDADALVDAVDVVVPTVEAAVRRLDELGARHESLDRHLGSLERLLPLAPDLVELAGYETMALLIDRRHAAALDALREELRRVAKERFELVSGVVDAQTLGAFVVVPRELGAEIDALLTRGQVRRVRLPVELEALSFRASLDAMREELEGLPERIARQRAELATLLGPVAPWAEAAGEIRRAQARLDLCRRIGATDRAFVVVGWMPAPRERELGAAIADAIGDEVLVAPAATRDDEQPPVLLSNHGLARPFESLVRAFSLPRAGTLDPTPLMALFLPLFFGMMLGDIGYGVVLLAASLFAIRRIGAAARAKGRPATGGELGDIARVLAMGSAWGILWGVVFGELFGGLGHRFLHLAPLWFSREDAHAVGPLLGFSVAVGAVHVLLGLVIGVWTAWRTKARGKMVERIGMLASLASLFVLAAAAVGRLPRGFMTPATAALVVGVVALAAPQGRLGILTGPLELLGTIGNVLSYLRIAALGLASVYLARVANEISVAAPLWLGAVVAVLFHALNIVLGAFSPTIQALRLHYVEFFGKFHEDGGAAFAPFGAETAAAPTTLAAGAPSRAPA